MTYIIAGLGNPEPDYTDTRHNVGRMVLEDLKKEKGFSDWGKRKDLKALVSEGELGGEKVLLVEPDNYMNNSGESFRKLIKIDKEKSLLDKYIRDYEGVEHFIVVHDDIDLPTGALRISFDRGTGGHKGVESIIKNIKTRAFVRVRVGIAPVTSEGVARKPIGENAVEKYVLKKFTKEDREKIDKTIKKAVSAIETIISDGRDKAMGEWN